MFTPKKPESPRIYVACLAAYNSGKLHGRWIDATQDIDQIWSELRQMLAASPVPDAEEWAAHDFEGFGSLHLSEHEGIERVHELALFIEEHEEIGIGLLEYYCGDLENANRALENYMGCFKSLSDYAEQLTDETIEIPKSLQYYIDYESMARDMEMNGDVFTVETGFEKIHVFLNC